MCTSHGRECDSGGAQKQNKFNLLAYVDIMKSEKIEILLPVRVGSMVLKNKFSMQIRIKGRRLHFARQLLLFFENHKNRSGGPFWSAGRNAQGRWGDPWEVLHMQT